LPEKPLPDAGPEALHSIHDVLVEGDPHIVSELQVEVENFD
jgi:hypothetical protein